MYRYAKILVVLNLEEHNASLVHYASTVVSMAGSSVVRFVLVRGEEPEAAMLEEFPELAPVPSEQALQEVKDIVADRFTPAAGALSYAVVSGNPVRELLEEVRTLEADLVIVGRRSRVKLSGTLGERLARKAPCSVLSVPGGSPAQITKVVVGMAFGESCRDALDVALAFGEAAHAEVKVVHVYRVPPGYYKTGKSYDEFGASLRRISQEKFRELVSDVGQRAIGVEPILVQDDKPYRGILRAAEVIGADLIVTAARGRSASAALFLGSVTERLIEHADVPVVAVKQKGDGLSLLEALLAG